MAVTKALGSFEGFLIPVVRAPRGCTEDEGRPLGVGLQEQASNHLKLHLLRAGVVSVKGKAFVKVSGMNQQR